MLHNSHLLASKLFKLPQHSLINFDVLSEKDKEREMEKQELPDDDSSSHLNSAALKRSRKKRRSIMKEAADTRGKSFDDVTDADSFRTTATTDNQSDDDETVSNQTIDKDRKLIDKDRKLRSESMSDSLDTATICGDLQVSRIVEVSSV